MLERLLESVALEFSDAFHLAGTNMVPRVRQLMPDRVGACLVRHSNDVKRIEIAAGRCQVFRLYPAGKFRWQAAGRPESHAGLAHGIELMQGERAHRRSDLGDALRRQI